MDLSKRTSDLIDQENRHFSISDEKVPPEISDKVPDAVMDKEMLPEISNEKVSPEISDKKVLPKISNKKVSPEISDEKVPPEISDKVPNAFMDHEVLPEISDKRVSPEISDKKVLPKISNKKVSPEISDEKLPPEISDKVPNAFMDHEVLPEISDKRVSPKISDKVSDNWKHASFDLDDYARGIKPKLMYHCVKCDKKYDNIKTLNYHFKNTHEKEIVFKCKICYKRFRVEQNLKQHVTLYHDKKNSPEVKLHRCSQCPNFFDKESSLNHHMILMHGSIKNDKQLSQEKSHFQCSKCPNVFKNEISLNEHMSLMHCSNKNNEKFVGIEDKYQQISNTVSQPLAKDISVSIICAQAETKAENKTLPFKCKMCYKSFQIEQNLELHMNFQHGKQVPQEKKLFHCSKKVNLENHESLMHLSKKLVKVSYPNAKCAIKDLKRNRRNKKQ